MIKQYNKTVKNICDPKKSCDLFYEEDKKKRPCSLLYTVSSCV